MQIAKHPLNLTARWVHEFENRNRVEGDLLTLSAALSF
jgi:hypothetical protein